MVRPRITATVLQYGHWASTVESVRSLLRSRLQPQRIVVVDNASPDDSCAQIAAWLASQGPFTEVAPGDPPADTQLVLLVMPVNGGYAAGNNAGLRQQPDADAWLILNNDAILTPESLGTMYRAMQSSSRPGLCGPTIAYPAIAGEESIVQCCAGGHTNYLTGLSSFTGEGLTVSEARKLDTWAVEENLNFICGACVLASKHFIAQVGLLDERFFLYCEEQDWVLRAREGFSLTWAKDALCIHQEGVSTGWNRQTFHWESGLRLLRSRLRVAFIHHPVYLPTVALGSLFATGRILLRKLGSQISTQKAV